VTSCGSAPSARLGGHPAPPDLRALLTPRTAAGVAALAALLADPARALVALDYDGTLAPFVLDPLAAVPASGAADVLAALAALVGEVALVTGRPADVAASLAGLTTDPRLARVAVVGQYGAQRWTGGVLTSAPAAPGIAGLRTRLPSLLAEAPAGVHVEDKGLALAVHTRPAADPAAALAALAPALTALAAELGLDLVAGSDVLELRSPGPDKGETVRGLGAGRSAVLYAGDDDGDLPVLAAAQELRAGGVPVVVVCSGRPDGPVALRERADLVVDGPAGVVAALRTLVGALGTR